MKWSTDIRQIKILYGRGTMWYGNYEGGPMRYRVLDPHSTKYGGDTILLDCDTVLYSAVFYDYVTSHEDAQFSHR